MWLYNSMSEKSKRNTGLTKLGSKLLVCYLCHSTLIWTHTSLQI